MMNREKIPTDLMLKKFMYETRVLIVDSNFTYRVALKQAMFSFGANPGNVHVARNLIEAREIMQDFQPQIIFSDLLLDDGAGTDLLNDQKLKSVLILLCSVFPEDTLVSGKKMGVNQYIYKPCSQIQIRDTLRNVMQKNWS